LLSSSIGNKEKIAQFIAKYEIGESRILQLNELKKGFDVFNIIEVYNYKFLL
jgi:hypothetical protein